VYAGVIESVSRLCEALVEGGQSVDVFTTTANGESELDVSPGVRLNVDGVNVIYFKRVTKDPTHASPALWMHLWRNVHKYDVVHIHSWWNILVIVSAWICIFRRTKIIISPRGMLTSYIFNSSRIRTKKWIHKLIGQQALAKSVLHATAPAEYEECVRLIKGWKGFVLPNILTLSAVDVHRTHNECFTMLFLSRIHPKKGLELLFQALTEVPFDFRLKIGGSGDEDYVAELKKYTERLGIAEKVEWLGWLGREAKFQELMRSDCFVLTSHNENFANVVIESLHVGTPVIISEEVGLAPFIRERKLGWVTTLNPSSIRGAIISAHDDVAQRGFVNASGQAIISQSFDAPALIEQYVYNYSCLIQAMGFPEVLNV
jgi:glycosyltransferase involved in cell wall biosynthesis